METHVDGLTWATSSKSSCLFCRARALWRDFPTPVCLLRNASPWFSIQSITWMREKATINFTASQDLKGGSGTVCSWRCTHPSFWQRTYRLSVQNGLKPHELKMGTDETFMICVGNLGHCCWEERDVEYSVPLVDCYRKLMCKPDVQTTARHLLCWFAAVIISIISYDQLFSSAPTLFKL